jgi:metal-responsive CopG/Arc/MetJ family transcriptional regulator
VASLRLPEKLATAIDKWAAKQKDEPSRSEAIRRLLEEALEAHKCQKNQK